MRLPILLLLVSGSLAAAAQAQLAPRPADWDPASAAAYLDQRMDDWFAKAEKLRTDDGSTTCVSCHTVVPYALARPALRRALNADTPTAQETRLLEETARRVRTYGSHQLLYGFDQNKRAESEGMEAVLYALILTSLNPAARGEAGDVTRAAIARLWQMQRPDGAWDWLDVGLEPFESIDSRYLGASFAAIAVGMAGVSDDAEVRRGVGRLQMFLRDGFTQQSVHNRLWATLASASIDSVVTPAMRDALVAELERRQNADGGWALDRLGEFRWNRTTAPFESPGPRDRSQSAASDGYATGLVVFTLKRTGATAQHALVQSGLEWLRANQHQIRVGDREWRAWRAHSLNYDREHGGARGEPWRRLFMSDAATALAALALLE